MEELNRILFSFITEWVIPSILGFGIGYILGLASRKVQRKQNE